MTEHMRMLYFGGYGASSMNRSHIELGNQFRVAWHCVIAEMLLCGAQGLLCGWLKTSFGKKSTTVHIYMVWDCLLQLFQAQRLAENFRSIICYKFCQSTNERGFLSYGRGGTPISTFDRKWLKTSDFYIYLVIVSSEPGTLVACLPSKKLGSLFPWWRRHRPWKLQFIVGWFIPRHSLVLTKVIHFGLLRPGTLQFMKQDIAKTLTLLLLSRSMLWFRRCFFFLCGS